MAKLKRISSEQAKKFGGTHKIVIPAQDLNFRPVYALTPELIEKIETTERLVRAMSEHRRAEAVTCKRRLRMLECTQAAFNRLPGLVSNTEFRDWTGLSEKELREEVQAGRIQVYRGKENGYARYYKHEIARLTGFKL